jgi:hypothetical protein
VLALLKDVRCCCLLLQEFVASCVQEGEEDSGGHIPRRGRRIVEDIYPKMYLRRTRINSQMLKIAHPSTSLIYTRINTQQQLHVTQFEPLVRINAQIEHLWAGGRACLSSRRAGPKGSALGQPTAMACTRTKRRYDFSRKTPGVFYILPKIDQRGKGVPCRNSTTFILHAATAETQRAH